MPHGQKIKIDRKMRRRKGKNDENRFWKENKNEIRSRWIDEVQGKIPTFEAPRCRIKSNHEANKLEY